MEAIILFDGECHFCDRSVQFIIKRDPQAYFKFASLQSDYGQRCLAQFHVSPTINSLVLIESQKCFMKSSAALRICRRLKGGWKLFYLLLAVPRPIRDACYQVLAKNRYRWFGKLEACSLPTPDMRKRFLS